ncbi:sodium-coupled monocarboxylate transporter 1 [Aplysia californica]|uniref:Sodium-coupled monocarboxylate transporter 1 n=1 Tax=Aplysia californica TaxID=6500 RepID=A0ABM1A8R8_APLCA|nr:sodium-coupled monocarboxylate transporter 1 [Aplysia californica]
MAQVRNEFTAWDYVVFAAMLLVSIGIGIYFAIRGRRQTSQGDYLLASRSLGVIPVAISILVSFMSAILILGTPAEMFTQGVEYILVIFGMVLGIVIATFLCIPLFYPLKMTSVFEYLERRYHSRFARLTGTVLMIVTQILYVGIAAFAPSTALEAVTGFPVWATIVTIGVVGTFYTSIGGMRAVVWTDVFQSVVMLAGLLAIVIEGTNQAGGLERVWTVADKWKRLEFFNFDPDPTVRHTVWSLTFGAGLQYMAVYGLNQASVQRYCSLPTMSAARSSILLNIVGVIVMVTITCLAGIVMFAYYAGQNCNPLRQRLVDNPNQLIPFFVMDTLAFPGVPGLFISSIFSGALSSVSSSLSAMAAITWEDVFKPHLDHKMNEGQKTLFTKFLVVFYGGCAVGMSFIAGTLEGTVLQATVSLMATAAGPLTGMFVLGAFFPWANAWGAITGAAVALTVCMWLSIGSYIAGVNYKAIPFPTGTCSIGILNSTTTTVAMTTSIATTAAMSTAGAPPVPEDSSIDEFLSYMYSISYMWYTAIGMTVVVIVGLPVSFLTGANSMHDVPTKYQIPLFSRLFCCLPDSWLNFLNCKREFQKPEDIRPDMEDEEMRIDPLTSNSNEKVLQKNGHVPPSTKTSIYPDQVTSLSNESEKQKLEETAPINLGNANPTVPLYPHADLPSYNNQ